MANPFMDIFSGALGEANTQRANTQQLDQALRSMIFEAKLKQLYDPEAQFKKQIMDLISGGGQGGQPMPQPRPQVPVSIQNIPGAAMSLPSGGIGNAQGQPIDLASALSRMQTQAQPQASQTPSFGGGFRLGNINVGGMNIERIPTEQEELKKMEQSPFYQERKFKRTEDLLSTLEQNKVQREMIGKAQSSTANIPTGLGGKVSMWWKKMFDSENPVMEDWQNIKMVLTDAQLLNTAKTKGAISDREMELFARAASNDDIASVMAMKPVFNKLIKFIDSEEKAKITAYKSIYGEDIEGSGVTINASPNDLNYLKSKYGLR